MLANYSSYIQAKKQWRDEELWDRREKMIAQGASLNIDPSLVPLNNWMPKPAKLKHLLEHDKLTEAVKKGIQFKEIKFLSHCPYCKTPLSSIGDGWFENDFYFIYLREGDECENLKVCNNCGWWLVFHTVCWVEYACDQNLYEGALRKYDENQYDTPLQSLRRHLLKHHKKLFTLDPTKFERLVADVFRDFYTCEVKHIGGPGDNGIDIYAVINNNPFLVQVKRRSRFDYTEGPRIVRELIGSLIISNEKHGIIVSSANKFSDKAVQTAQMARDFVDIQLMNRNEFLKIMELTASKDLKAPWHNIVKSPEFKQITYSDV